MRQVLERTLGIPIFQEQVIELAMVAAGFTAGEADQLRRAMAAWKRRGGLESFQEKLINGMLQRGHDMAFAERVFKQIQGFGEYGFPESHAASFALLVYVSAWLKRHSPAAFYCGLLNSLPMGFYSPSQLLQDAQRHDVVVLPIDVQCSTWDHQLETHSQTSPHSAQLSNNVAIRLGLRMVKGLHQDVAETISAAQPFNNLADLTHRATPNKSALECLARAGGLKALTGNRRQAHWDVAGLTPPNPLERSAKVATRYTTQVRLEEPTATEDMFADYRYTGLTLGPHPMTLLREQPEFANCATALGLQRYRHGQFTRIAGLITGRQRPGSAAGVMFLTVEDETGNSNVVIWTSILQRFRAALLQSQLVIIKGVVERESEVIHVVAGHVSDASHYLNEIDAFKSRDFH